MDPATAISLCKENIQPLRHGRNVTQLGTALRAQDDAEAQQYLLREKRIFEDAIKDYEGDDPLENWYEYILWAEQSYPKNSHESHIGRLLEQCLETFEKERKYHQDRRYIRLWINYISMQKNPLEIYQLLYNNGVGTMVADTYRAWAFELEQAEDFKRADQVYALGLSARAEPLDELEHAHRNFQLAVGRKTLGRGDERGEVSVAEQRQAFSSLRAIRAGKKVSSVRTGHRVRDYLPGAVPQVAPIMHAPRANPRIQIYQDDEARYGEPRGSSILDYVPTEQVHKENTIKPGPWSGSAKKCPLIPSTVKMPFKVHEDQSDNCYDMEKVRLFPNHTPFYDGSKYHDHLLVPVFVNDPPNPNVITKVHYPKELVYADNMDRSMEEIKARKYLERKAALDRQKCCRLEQQQQEEQTLPSLDRPDQLGHSERGESIVQSQAAERGELLLVEHRQQELESLRLLEQRRRDNELHRMERQRTERQQELARQQLEAEQQRELARQRLEAEQQQRELARQRLEAEQQQELARQRLEAEQQQREIARQRLEAEQQRELARQRLEAEQQQRELARQRLEAEQQQQQQQQQQRLIEAEQQQQQQREIERRRCENEQLELERRRRVAEQQRELERQRYEAERRERERLEAERIEAERIEAERIEAQRMEAELDRQQKMHSSNYMHPHHRSDPSSEHLLGQSITVNTKEALSAVQDLWRSPEASGDSPIGAAVDGVMARGIAETRSKLSFDIHMDSSMTQQAMSSSKRQHDEYNVQPYNDQENHHFQPPFAAPEHEMPYANHGYPSSYHYQMQMQHLPPLHHAHPSPHVHQQPSMYPSVAPSDVSYQQQYHASMQSSPPHHAVVDHHKQLQFAPYVDADAESGKPYKMPSELPYIRSPGMNRRDLKYLEGAEDKENAIAVDYSEPIEEHPPKQTAENELYVDESLGTAPLASGNETCFTQAFDTRLTSSTPMTNHFRQPYRVKEVEQFQESVAAAGRAALDVRPSDVDEKLSVIMESTREYISSSSGSSSVNTRTTGFTLSREDMVPIKEQSSNQEMESTESLLAANQTYEQKMRAQIQAVHAQSPRTVQRNVDEITSEIKNNCDLRKSISFKLDDEKDDSMDCEYHHQEPTEKMEEESFELPSGDINPFDKSLIAGLLKKLKFPRPHHAEGYVRLDTNLNKFVPSTMVTLGTEAYDLEKCLGKGTYGTVFKAVNLQTGQIVALKTQKPAWVWEFYIAREIKARLTNPHMLRGFMDVTTAYVANNASTLVSEFSKYGTLLAVTNQVKISTGKPLSEALAIFFTIEMLQIVEHLHKCQIIHGDIKPDNFLLMHLPMEDVRPTIQLIDFGCSIDMSLLPEGTRFNQVIKTEDFICTEMQTGRPWTYQTDLYCLAASSHCLLFGNYMRVSNVGGRWFINAKIPRYTKKATWERYFTELLNVESCEKMLDLGNLRISMEEALSQVSDMRASIRNFCNILNKR